MLFLAIWPATADATITKNEIGCAGSAEIVDGSKTYQLDANDSEVKVPRKGTINWEGSIETVTHNHSGEVTINVLGFSVSAGSWGPSQNASSASHLAGEKPIPSIMELVPPGKYAVEGFHKGDEGECAGKLTIDVAGSALSNPASIVAILGTIVSGVGLALAAVAKVKAATV
jgi:hypothetical protein